MSLLDHFDLQLLSMFDVYKQRYMFPVLLSKLYSIASYIERSSVSQDSQDVYFSVHVVRNMAFLSI